MKKVGLSKAVCYGGQVKVEGVVWDYDNGRYQDVSGVVDLEKLLEFIGDRLLRSKRGVATDNGGAVKMKVFKVKKEAA